MLGCETFALLDHVLVELEANAAANFDLGMVLTHLAVGNHRDQPALCSILVGHWRDAGDKPVTVPLGSTC